MPSSPSCCDFKNTKEETDEEADRKTELRCYGNFTSSILKQDVYFPCCQTNVPYDTVSGQQLQVEGQHTGLPQPQLHCNI